MKSIESHDIKKSKCFICCECLKEFTNLDECTAHLRDKHPLNPSPIPISSKKGKYDNISKICWVPNCNNNFPDTNGLIQHIKNNHRELGDEGMDYYISAIKIYYSVKQ